MKKKTTIKLTAAAILLAIVIIMQLLKNISAERVYAELTKLLCGECREILLDYADVLAVVRLDAPDWMGTLKSRPDVTVLTVTAENRDSVPGQLRALLK